jgi:hypothetical protein
VSELVFKDPPANVQLQSKWKRKADELTAYPGRWVLVGVFGTTTASNGRNRLRFFGCEATVRRVEGDSDQYELYARWPESTNGSAS